MTDDIWDCALEPFAEHPAAAFIFAQTLFMLKEKIRSGPEGSLLVVQAIEQGIEKLYPYTAAHQAAYNSTCLLSRETCSQNMIRH